MRRFTDRHPKAIAVALLLVCGTVMIGSGVRAIKQGKPGWTNHYGLFTEATWTLGLGVVFVAGGIGTLLFVKPSTAKAKGKKGRK